MLLELGCAEARTDEAQDVACDGEEGAELAEARVQAHAQRQEDFTELFVCQGRELPVVVKGEVLDQERGDEARAQGVDAKGHSARERVSDFLLHDADHECDSVVFFKLRRSLRHVHILPILLPLLDPLFLALPLPLSLPVLQPEHVAK